MIPNTENDLILSLCIIPAIPKTSPNKFTAKHPSIAKPTTIDSGELSSKACFVPSKPAMAITKKINIPVAIEIIKDATPNPE